MNVIVNSLLLLRLFEYVHILTYFIIGHRHFFALSDKKKVRYVVVESG